MFSRNVKTQQQQATKVFEKEINVLGQALVAMNARERVPF